MKNKKFLLITLLSLIMVNCDDSDIIELKSFPTQAVNIEQINTAYDEMNETITGFVDSYMLFVLSSNENSEGTNFDMLNYLLNVNSNADNSDFTFDLNKSGHDYYNNLIDKVNTDANEDNFYDIFFYTSDSQDNSDLLYVKGNPHAQTWEEIDTLKRLNTNFDENDINTLLSEIIYSSNVNGDYDIFIANIDTDISLLSWLSSTSSTRIDNFEILNSSADDRCPHISGNYIFFASNRDGGFGGYDLYYSHYVSGMWTEPVNCGEKINTEYDELNPVAVFYSNYKNDLLFFSSNKTEGKGGFDIYSVGIPKLTK